MDIIERNIEIFLYTICEEGWREGRWGKREREREKEKERVNYYYTLSLEADVLKLKHNNITGNKMTSKSGNVTHHWTRELWLEFQ